MAKKGRGGKKRKPNYKLPPDDHLVVRPIRRNKQQKTEARIAGLLTHHWDLFTSKDREAAVMAAYIFGSNLAKAAWKDCDEDACGDAKDYRRDCVRFAFEDCKVINDVERELWRSVDPNDPRLAAYEMGFTEETDRLRETG